MVQSILVPIAIPESDNPLATGDSNKGWFAAFALALVLAALAVVTLPVALALFWAVSQESLALVTVFAGAHTRRWRPRLPRRRVPIAARRWSRRRARPASRRSLRLADLRHGAVA